MSILVFVYGIEVRILNAQGAFLTTHRSDKKVYDQDAFFVSNFAVQLSYKREEVSFWNVARAKSLLSINGLLLKLMYVSMAFLCL